MSYGYAPDVALKETYSTQLGGTAETKVFDRCIGEANVIREQVMEAARLAYDIMARLSGPQPECDSAENVKELPTGGALGELQRIQGGTVSTLAELRRTLEQVARLV